MTRDDMLRTEVARRLRGAGVPADATAVAEAINSIRQDIAAVIAQLGYALLGCTTDGCLCLVSAVVYEDAAREIMEKAA